MSQSIFNWISRKPLGRLEQLVLREVQSRGSATVRELLESDAIALAYTTVMTTMDRLYKKGLLERNAEGKAFRYIARLTLDEMQRMAAVEGIRQLMAPGDTSSLVLSNLVDTLSAQDTKLLDELESLVERKRRELKKKEER